MPKTKDTAKSTSTKAIADKGKETVTVLNKPLITEKAANGAQYSVYLFDVQVGATKSEIAKAFKAKYKETPIKVNTVNVIRKSHFRRGRLGFGISLKKAYVFLKKGTTINIA